MKFIIKHTIHFDDDDEPSRLALQCNNNGKDSLCPVHNPSKFCPFNAPCQFIRKEDWERLHNHKVEIRSSGWASEAL